jgi:hypothetical protein
MNGLMGSQADGLLVRYGYVDTRSSAGRPERIELRASDVTEARKWYNVNGNPSYTLRLADGRTLFLVDDYGAMNGLYHVSAWTVDRRKDLFLGWVR